jgi:spermidine/putrescine transport system substrate-binding protein
MANKSVPHSSLLRRFTLIGRIASVLAGAVCLGTFALGTALSVQAENKLNFFTWSEYIDPAIITDFEKKFSCKVNVDLYEDNESLLAKLESGGVAAYDVIVPSDYIVPALKANKLLAPLRRENIPNLANIDSRFTNAPHDPGNEFTAPYQWGTVGIFVRLKAGEQIEETWGLYFDPKKQLGPFVLIDNARDSLATAFKYLGASISSTDKETIAKARDLLLDAKKRSVGLDGGIGGRNKVLAQVAKMAVTYNGDAVRAMKDDPETFFFVPREGAQMWVDNMAIPAQAPNKELAEKFINYILDAKVGAQLSNFNQFATPNKASLPMINEADKNNRAIYPTPEIMEKLEFFKDLGATSRLYDEVWTQIKAD